MAHGGNQFGIYMDEEVPEANSPRFASSDEDDEEVREDARSPHLQEGEAMMPGEDNSGAGESLGIIPHRRPQKTTNAQRVQLLNQQLRSNNQPSGAGGGQGTALN